ncbi:hypothetical protein [Paraglaciecola sp. L3A3]|uniref:hypothetical protein n=1 Tax=Paraglaciecola sp. L3A3 TaxID=2686358 RepID=UPI001E621933|nr:hypothetical protein [Paraglaciecola sp. L3A3]
MRKVLTICYTQTGQLAAIKKSVCGALEESDRISVETLVIEPEKHFPFPWPFLQFFRIFPETVAMQPVDLKPITTEYEQ